MTDDNPFNDIFRKISKMKTEKEMSDFCTSLLGSKFEEVQKRHKELTKNPKKTKLVNDKIVDVEDDDPTAGTETFTAGYTRESNTSTDGNVEKWKTSKKYLKNLKKKQLKKGK